MTQNSENSILNPQKSYIAVSLDPIHFGAGSYRIGRVDNTIIREPGTNLPKGPGTSLKGCIKYCADIILRYEFKRESSCAGAKGCGEDTCPICSTFGYSKEKKNREGSISIFDAQVALFPVYSNKGPKWITTEEILKNFFNATAKTETEETESALLTPSESVETGPSTEVDTECNIEAYKEVKKEKREEQLRLGWLYLPVKKEKKYLKSKLFKQLSDKYTAITEHIVIVNYKTFIHLVNSNLEVRTSNAINPETGAVEQGALFTYEALPMTTVLKFDTVLNAYREAVTRKICELGMYYLRYYGAGGMNTRGFGRLNVLLDNTPDELITEIKKTYNIIDSEE